MQFETFCVLDASAPVCVQHACTQSLQSLIVSPCSTDACRRSLVVTTPQVHTMRRQYQSLFLLRHFCSIVIQHFHVEPLDIDPSRRSRTTTCCTPVMLAAAFGELCCHYMPYAPYHPVVMVKSYTEIEIFISQPCEVHCVLLSVPSWA